MPKHGVAIQKLDYFYTSFNVYFCTTVARYNINHVCMFDSRASGHKMHGQEEEGNYSKKKNEHGTMNSGHIERGFSARMNKLMHFAHRN